MNCSASRVPSRAHEGQKTGTGILPPTGSTSKAYFWPQAQMILTGIMRSPEKRFLFGEQFVAVPERDAPRDDFAEIFVIVATEREGSPASEKLRRDFGFQNSLLRQTARADAAQFGAQF